jgi:predicted esterase
MAQGGNAGMSGPALHRGQPVLRSGHALEGARAAAILLHGRGGSAEDMIGFAEALPYAQFAYLVPQAAGHTWYPERFLAPLGENEPWLGSALAVIAGLLTECSRAHIPPDRVVIGGFSQGACLALEFAARHPRRYGAVLGLSGSLIGPPEAARDDRGDLAGTPVLLGCSDIDRHIPLASVKASAAAMRRLGADVTERIYPGMGHVICDDELDWARERMLRLTAAV